MRPAGDERIDVLTLSGLAKFEGPDPAYWCAKGYAICNPDTRGVYESDGDGVMCGEQDGEDRHDVIEWRQSWREQRRPHNSADALLRTGVSKKLKGKCHSLRIRLSQRAKQANVRTCRRELHPHAA